jgi:K+-sensing histidine kinase KdpD
LCRPGAFEPPNDCARSEGLRKSVPVTPALKSLHSEELRWSSIAVLTVLVVSAMIEIKRPMLADGSLMVLLMAILVSAWFGGFRAGLAATVTSLLIATYLFIPPEYSFRIASRRDLVYLSLTGAEGLFISWLCGQRRRLQLANRSLAAELSALRAEPAQSLRAVTDLEADLRQLRAALPIWLRAPLKTIGEGRQTLADCCKRQPGAEEAVARMSRAERRILAFGNTVDSFSQVYRERRSEPVSSPLRLAEIIDSLQPMVKESGASIDLPELLPALCIRKSDLFCILQELVSNALRHSGPEPPRILISGRERAGQFRFAISHDGSGMIPLHAAEAFSWFGQHGAVDSEHFRVSLATVRRMVRSHGGDIWLKSSPGVGTTVSFTIPIAS